MVAYDSVKQRVKLSDGSGFTKTFPVAEVWLAAPRKARARGARMRVYALIGAGAGLGALVGSIITALLMR